MSKKYYKRGKIKPYSIYDNISNISIDIVDDIRSIYDGCELLNNRDTINEESMHRILVNNIRHDHTNYDKGLKKMKKDYGNYYTETIYTQYKNAVLNKIAMSYPFLADECTRQKSELYMTRSINRQKVKKYTDINT